MSQLDMFGGGGGPGVSKDVGLAEQPEEILELAEALPAGLRFGTSSWSFPGWEGFVWDRKTHERQLARSGLAAYAQHPLFRTVGLDRTYYAPMAAHELTTLVEETPEDFRLLVKALEDCVLPYFPDHPRYARRRGDRNEHFLLPGHARDVVVEAALKGLGPRLGVLLFQFPPLPTDAFGKSPEHFAEALHAFLAELPAEARYAVELRNEKLLTPVYAEALADVGAVHCHNAWPKMPAVTEQAGRVPQDGPLVIRWMLQKGYTYQSAKDAFGDFHRLAAPDPDTRGELAERIREALGDGREVIVVVNNKAEGSSPLSIVELARAVVDG